MRRALALVVVAALLVGGCSFEPEVTQPIHTVQAQTTTVYAADGSLVTKLHAEQDRVDVVLDELPDHLVDAVVAIEDERFWEHGGVDIRATVRAALTNVGAGDVAQGGSTITQQYVKNVLLNRERTLNRKLREASLAMQLEDRYTKERILELYLNTIYFGNGAYGVEAAARRYFGGAAADLTLAQSALLAGLIQAPSASDPYQQPDAARARRNVVIGKMAELGKVTPQAATAAKRTDLGLVEQRREDRYPAPHFVERVKRFILDDPRFGATRADREKLLFTGGLRIVTTLDPDLQDAAQRAVRQVLSRPGDPEAAVVSLEPRTGEVRALVGGSDFFGPSKYAKLDLASQGGRPAGSSFKPIVLGAAVEKGIPLTRKFPAPPSLRIPLSDEVWDVDNYAFESGGTVNLVDATVHSYNTVFARLMLEVGPEDAVAFAHRLGITSPLPSLPAIVLGTENVTPLEMASAYGTYATGGLRLPPVFVTKVTGPDGQVLYEHRRDPQRVIPPDVAARVTSVLRQVIERGTGVAARIGRPAAGKTGTNQDWKDAWFVGFTPDLATSVWVGYPRQQLAMVPPRTPIRVTGGSWPAQIWQLYMSAALADVPVTPFLNPQAPVPGGVQPLTAVPDVLGFPFAQAKARLTRAGFTVVRNDVPSSEYPPGTVVAQTPAAGEQAPGGSQVILDVANGSPETGAVPDLLGLTPSAALVRLREAGFVGEVVVEAEPASPGSATRAGLVWRQNPAGGTIRVLGATVTIWANPSATTTTAAAPTTTTAPPGDGGNGKNG